ncbi:tRNA dimethylallyltransferase [Lishizhenia tianjinensis]|uniref:tRNA dimethylallyltransferase n=1 Tax=Lishizhenia tianjinensis TaxID=477690 RepID=A0A1I6Z185_9FLAO|nr:tRNA (adenosine(37)-N6)-dimethylallyltransferase MiaA [Lishizhenia tianjinensis]SFT56495.1 tRNA dimethylallyltransferase [Lishizhenia tianjinensis]
MKSLVVIGGPTASGKTGLSVALAKQLKCPILSADSRQFYKEVAIGTAKPSPEEQEGVPHYFIDSHSLQNPLSSGAFEEEAIPLIEKLFQEHDTLILTGGSGLFIDAILYGIDNIPKDNKVKEHYIQLQEAQGLDVLLAELAAKDPEYYQEVDKGNSHRVIRALEAIACSGQKFSELRKHTQKPRNFTPYIFLLDHEREALYSRINQRVDIMLQEGLLEEVKSVAHLRHLQSLNTVGYKEVFDYLDGKTSLEECVELIKRNTRRYAKRQITWFKRYKDASWIPYTNIEEMTAFIRKRLQVK